MRMQIRAKLIQQTRQNKRERLKFLQGMLQLKRLFEAERRLHQNHLAIAFALGELLQTPPRLAQPLCHSSQRQSGKITKRAQAPKLQRLLYSGNSLLLNISQGIVKGL